MGFGSFGRQVDRHALASTLHLKPYAGLQRTAGAQVRSYERFTPLSIEREGLKRGYLDVRPGDCVVAFSRRDIYDIKHMIEAGTGQRCASPSPLPPARPVACGA